MNLRKLSPRELLELKVGDEVFVRYFDPSGPNRDPETNMTTDKGKVVDKGQNFDEDGRDILVEFEREWPWPRTERWPYFGSSILVDR